MILLIDAGNSRLKWAFVNESGELLSGGALSRIGREPKDVSQEAWGELEPPARVLVANVAGDRLRRSLTSWMKRRWKLTPEFATTQTEQFGVHCAYEEPTALGVDRWMALLAARELAHGPVLIVDLGSACTVDALDGDGRHLGGLILPGLGTMRTSLIEGTDAIDELEVREDESKSLLPTDTGNAVIVGTLYSLVATVDRVCADVRADLGPKLTILLTGGDAEQLLPMLHGKPRHEPELVLKGLRRVALDAAEQEDKPEPAPAKEEGKEKPKKKAKKKTTKRPKKKAEVKEEQE